MDPNTQQPNTQPVIPPTQPVLETQQPIIAPTNMTPPPKKNNSLIIILILTIIMAALLGGVYFYVIQSSTNKTTQAPATTEQMPTTIPTITPTPEVLGNEQTELETMTDVGDPTTELNELNKDLQQL